MWQPSLVQKARGMSDFPPAPKRIVHAEAILQIRLKMWVREAVVSPHKFFAFDRSAARGRFTHAREMARGIQRSTPDILLCVNGQMFWAELKDPRLNICTDERFAKKWPDQWQMGQELRALGHSWNWFKSVSAYWIWIRDRGIDLAPNARFLALQADATVASLIEAAELKKGVLPKRLRVKTPTEDPDVLAAMSEANEIEAARKGAPPKRFRSKGPRPTVSQVRRAERARMLP